MSVQEQALLDALKKTPGMMLAELAEVMVTIQAGSYRVGSGSARSSISRLSRRHPPLVEPYVVEGTRKRAWRLTEAGQERSQ